MSREITQIDKEKTPKSDVARRFMAIKDDKGVTWDVMAQDLGISKRTMQHSVWKTEVLSANLLRALHGKYGVSLNWLFSGEGNMYLNADKAAQNQAALPPEPSKTTTNAAVNEAQKPYQAAVSSQSRPLMPYNATVDMTQLQDFFYLCATAIEQSLMENGAVPGQDYTLLDLYKMAQPFVSAKFKDGSGLEVTIFEPASTD